MILPVAVTLKRFLALEFVFTLGIFTQFEIDTLEAFPTGGSLSNLFRKYYLHMQVVKELPFFKRVAKIRLQAGVTNSK